MFSVNEVKAATIRTAYLEEGELFAAIVFHRFFPGITDGARARECARIIAERLPSVPRGQ